MKDLCGTLEKWLQGGRALMVGRAALGLLVVLRAWRARRGKCRVAIPGMICHEVLLAVLAAGCEPLFCDVSVADGLVPESEWKRARMLGADVAIIVHLYGNPAPVQRIRSIFAGSACLVIDDAAQALGSHSSEGLCGSMGDIGLLSFGHSKQISIGNGALLVRDPAFAADIEAHLAALVPWPQDSRLQLQTAFRSRFDAARRRLSGDAGAVPQGFAGLLDAMEGVLHVPLDEGLSEPISVAIVHYPNSIQARIDKALVWRRSLTGTAFVPVGMGRGCVPWRFACRLPGIDWRAQAQLAESIRRRGIHVSTWYLPANWLVGQPAGTLPGVETLAREVFQFWLDDAATSKTIDESARAIREELQELSRHGANL